MTGRVLQHDQGATLLSEVCMVWRGRPARLTAKERAALSLSATGLDGTEIAEALHESPQAVREALASVVRKLGARSKLEAVLIALRTGEIDSSAL